LFFQGVAERWKCVFVVEFFAVGRFGVECARWNTNDARRDGGVSQEKPSRQLRHRRFLG
jgi:hypothetical protein